MIYNSLFLFVAHFMAHLEAFRFYFALLYYTPGISSLIRLQNVIFQQQYHDYTL